MDGDEEKKVLERHAEKMFGARPSGIDVTDRGLEVHFDVGQAPRVDSFPGAVLRYGEGPATADLLPVRWKYVFISKKLLRDAKRGFSWPLLAIWALLGLVCIVQFARVVLHNY